MIYSLLRAVAGVALRWYYADVTIVGDVTEAGDGPLLVVMNHPNALVDVLVAARSLPRRLLFTAKATLFSNPLSRLLLAWVGVIPLRRVGDEQGKTDPARNAESFAAMTTALARGGAILVFPEGKSHDEPAMSPLRTGTARIALHAKETATVRGLRILPIGLVFERKEIPRTRILAVVGEPLEIDTWRAEDPANAVAELTAAIDTRLRAVTLNYETVTEAAADARLSAQIAALVRYEAPSVGESGDLRDQTTVARLLPVVRAATASGSAALRDRSAAFLASLLAFQQTLDSHHISLDDLAISRKAAPGAWFVVREAFILAIAGPIAFWGWLNHFIPFKAAISVGNRTRDTAADPAMRTIIAGAAFVLMVYMFQGAAVALVAGPWWALAYVVSLPVAADINLRLRARFDRARRRARTYLLFRSHPQLHDELAATARSLRAEVLRLAMSS